MTQIINIAQILKDFAEQKEKEIQEYIKNWICSEIEEYTKYDDIANVLALALADYLKYRIHRGSNDSIIHVWDPEGVIQDMVVIVFSDGTAKFYKCK